MTLQDVFYLFGILFFLSLIGLNVYLVILVIKIKDNIIEFTSNVKQAAENVKRTAENVNLARYSLKAVALKTFLNFINPKGGDEDDS